MNYREQDLTEAIAKLEAENTAEATERKGRTLSMAMSLPLAIFFTLLGAYFFSTVLFIVCGLDLYRIYQHNEKIIKTNEKLIAKLDELNKLYASQTNKDLI